ncbi:uncharacterized protein LOC26536391 [Drosophila yakuba]|uniref:Uncharacterized protein n=1 Tax=Drosophila yakuba TaxID=7245 RepID=A0A0R1DY37_DROYA|nr:uncharacterized protein LOC26536391 [Drosophila yakuba]KRK01992.1 uncharacterized protein Dyak_GE29210 [Drosophila yakuba]
MKAVTSTALCSILVILLINFTSAKEKTAEVDLTSPPRQCRLECDSGFHIVVKKGTLYHNGKKLDENARYPPKMACDLERSCDFELTQQTYSYMNSKPDTGAQLTIKYDCKKDNFQGNPRRITDFKKTSGCPQDSFVQKHVAYFNDRSIAPDRDTPTAQREREMIAMGVSAQARRFRLSRSHLPTDSTTYTLYLILDNGKKDFLLKNSKCQLNDKAKTYKYTCNRGANKWTCTFKGKNSDLAIHDKDTGHLES